uniref:CSD domain-containing protein n=1 Tax=viral metagenome TaxID=1070528 RepID=A0A6C0DMP3_9ZZZZ
MSSTQEITETQPLRVIGQVKWFNNKAGYGFITVSDGEHANKDIFTHFSTIRVLNDQQYKYLVQGEYVEFDIIKSNNEAHEYQATNISGIKGGLLMCETRRNTRSPENGERETKSRPQKFVYDNKPSETNRIPDDTDFVSVRKRREPSTRGGRGGRGPQRRAPRQSEPVDK